MEPKPNKVDDFSSRRTPTLATSRRRTSFPVDLQAPFAQCRFQASGGGYARRDRTRLGVLTCPRSMVAQTEWCEML
jgi:hypothetical protein